jgi:transposase
MVASPAGELPAASAPADPSPILADADRPADSVIEVELPSGVKLRVTGAVDEAVLRRVLSALS